jgi:hypothetical protein
METGKRAETKLAAAMDWNGIFGYPGGCWHWICCQQKTYSIGDGEDVQARKSLLASIPVGF